MDAAVGEVEAGGVGVGGFSAVAELLLEVGLEAGVEEQVFGVAGLFAVGAGV